MIKKTMKMMAIAAGIMTLLCGCTKSNIVQPESETYGPDFNMYNNIQLDMDQLHDDVNDIYLDEKDYPVASAVDFEINLDDAYVNVIVVVKDDADNTEAAEYASDVVKGINDQVAVQDFTYGESSDNTFGGLYQDNIVNLKVYRESAYESGADPIYETQIPKDTYMTFDIQ